MLIMINPGTNQIEFITTVRPQGRLLSAAEKEIAIIEEPPPHLKAFHIIDDDLISKLWEAMDKSAIIESITPIFNDNGDLVDLAITEYGIGEER
jgi:hypothetical protein